MEVKDPKRVTMSGPINYLLKYSDAMADSTFMKQYKKMKVCSRFYYGGVGRQSRELRDGEEGGEDGIVLCEGVE